MAANNLDVETNNLDKHTLNAYGPEADGDDMELGCWDLPRTLGLQGSEPGDEDTLPQMVHSFVYKKFCEDGESSNFGVNIMEQSVAEDKVAYEVGYVVNMLGHVAYNEPYMQDYEYEPFIKLTAKFMIGILRPF